MSRIAFLVAVTALLTGPLFSQQTPELVAVAPLLANPQHYAGRRIALHGVVIDRSEAAGGGFKLIETKSSAGLSKQPSTVLATWAKGATMVSLKDGQEAIVIGRIQMQDNAPILQVANMITDKDAIRRFIHPSERRPRPGDNLGHDAQPDKSISD
jgi:hypothetical protein